MQFKTVFFALSALTAVAVAAPAEAAKRDNGYIWGCTKPDLQGDCAELATDWGQCLNIIGYLHDNMESLRIDPGIWCQLYEDINCTGKSISADDQGSYAAALPDGWTNTISSFMCFPRNT